LIKYEQILSKISPTFYKLIEYYNYFEYSYTMIFSYLQDTKNLQAYSYIPIPSTIYYIYHVYTREHTSYNTIYSSYYQKNIIIPETNHFKSILLGIKNEISNESDKKELNSGYLDEFIVDMVLNNFSFEEQYIGTSKTGLGYKKLFIDLVGEEMYETIRANVR